MTPKTLPKECPRPANPEPTCRCIDWFAEGESKAVEVAVVRIIVRLVGRRGRRGRIAIEAPDGAVFSSFENRQ